MSHLTSFEAKQVAAYLKASCSLVPEFAAPQKHGQWLDAISRSCGFRDWNSMSAVAPDVPDTELGERYGAFFGIARVLAQGQETTDHMVWFRNRDSVRHEAAAKLARSVLARAGVSLRGVRFKYSQPDSPRPLLEMATPALAKQSSKFPWRAEAPIVAVSEDQKTRVLLWWLSERYTMAERHPEREHVFSYQSLAFDEDGTPSTDWASAPANPESLTDCFLHNMTGVVPPKRTCYYVTEVPNGPEDSFIPVVVTEGIQDGELTGNNFGSVRGEALERVQLLNSEKGVTIADSHAISRRYRENEPHEEGPYFEYSGIHD
jgi:hypothetical protein